MLWPPHLFTASNAPGNAICEKQKEKREKVLLKFH